MASTPPIHPRPQLARPEWHELDGTWQFAYDDEVVGLAVAWQDREDVFDRSIVVPFPPESALSGVHETGYHPVAWYRRTFQCPRPDADERVHLTFGAVDYRAIVWVNGHRVADHEGGHTPFTADITTALVDSDGGSGEQVLVVRAEDWYDDVGQPRGKQDWWERPHGVWYHRTTGIWQPVWWERVNATHVSRLRLAPDVLQSRLDIEAQLARPLKNGLRLHVQVGCGGDPLADTSVAVTGPVVRLTADLPVARNYQDAHRITWSPESPTLLDVEVTVRDGERVVDRVTSYTGFRRVGYADGQFLLNHQPYFLRLVLAQGYWPQSHLAAPSPDALRREVELIKELGFNGVRVHQKVEDPRFLYWCDRLGLLAWGEMPSTYEYSTTAVERVTREWLDVVRRDVNHPSVVTWVPLNESWGLEVIEDDPAQRHYASALFHLTKALDPSRPAISNDGWEHTDSDIWGVHDYGPSPRGLAERYGTAEAVRRSLREGRPGRRRVLLQDDTDRGQPVVITEFGGLSLAPSAGEEWFGYSTVGSAEELGERFAALVGALLDSPYIAGLCYTQLTDIEQETNGLLTAGREPKVPTEVIRRALQQPAKANPAEEVDRTRDEGEHARRGDA